MKLFFNELSLNVDYNDAYNSKIIFEQFINTYHTAITNRNGFEREIVTCVNLNSINIARNYTVSKWRNDTDIDRDLIRRFVGMCDKQLISNLVEDEVELKCEKGAGKGLLAVYENNATCISLAYDEYWENYNIECVYYSLIEDFTSLVYVHNISNSKQLEENYTEIQKERKKEISSICTGKQLLAKIDALFPSLIFHRNAIDQLYGQVEAQHVSTICSKLLDLEKYFSEWDGRNFDKNAFPKRSVSPQSKETLKSFKKEHTYFLGEKEILVSYHMRYTGNIPGRIYFYPDSESRKAYICSLTTKLPTVTNPKSHV